ncbi:MAG: 3-oxoacyl-[acyl-carrier-protein] reductase [Thermoflexales bacterium]|nr:3-oxoacyl-[acyl-carrier-protein] reductase [Thermoflexales bacterium]MDW8351124.1 3-oxoacyl-[acyl-carrier-protein] reductase [Anaerolineae bacterium]
MGQLGGKSAIVTGASRGIGRAIAIELARRGAAVVVNYNTSETAAHDVVKTITESGGTAIAFKADVSKLDEAAALVKAALDAFGRLDILVNNAGTTRDTLLMTMSEEDWDTVISADLKSVFNCCKAAVRPMIRARSGRIINISSVVGLAGQGGQTNYAAAKAGVIGFTKSLAKELGSRNITVNAVAPGFIPTALTDVLTEEQKQAILKATPLGRFGTPEEVAYAVSFLASDEAAFITGAVLSVDGGLVMQ